MFLYARRTLVQILKENITKWYRLYNPLSTFAGCFDFLCQQLDDPHLAVRDTTAFTLGKILDNHLEIAPVSQEFIQKILQKMQDAPQIASRLLLAITTIVERHDELQSVGFDLTQTFVPFAQVQIIVNICRKIRIIFSTSLINMLAIFNTIWL